MENKLYAVSDEVTGETIKQVRKSLTLTQKEFAQLVNVSVKTIERWEAPKSVTSGPIVTLLKLLKEHPQIQESLRLPQREYPLRLFYMYNEEISTVIDVDEAGRRVKIHNYTGNLILRAFGKDENPTFEQYEQFLESRCFPRSRDKMKLVLEDINVPFYDPFMIIEKTQGRMAEDNCWIKIER